MLGGSRWPCADYWRICSRAGPAREAYARIVAPAMGYSWSSELEAALAASTLFDPGSVCAMLSSVGELLRGRRVCVVGPLARGLPGECEAVIAVEGVEGTYRGPPPSIIVGDADSGGPASYGLCGPGRACFIHFHSDNVPLAESAARLAGPWAVPTSQAYCIPPVLGLGGFTDGDRAAILAMVMAAREVMLEGFDFSQPYCAHKRGRGCNERSLSIKRVKLALADRVLSYAAPRLGYRRVGGRLIRILD